MLPATAVFSVSAVLNTVVAVLVISTVTATVTVTVMPDPFLAAFVSIRYSFMDVGVAAWLWGVTKNKS